MTLTRKIAVIDHRRKEEREMDIGLLAESFAKEGIKIDGERTRKTFEKKFGPLTRYDGILIHPGISSQKTLLNLLQEQGLPKKAIVTLSAGDCESPKSEDEVPLFFYGESAQMKAYFFPKY